MTAVVTASTVAAAGVPGALRHAHVSSSKAPPTSGGAVVASSSVRPVVGVAGPPVVISKGSALLLSPGPEGSPWPLDPAPELSSAGGSGAAGNGPVITKVRPLPHRLANRA